MGRKRAEIAQDDLLALGVVQQLLPLRRNLLEAERLEHGNTRLHLFDALSFSRTGITLPFYVAVIAGLLMHVRSGRKVNKYMLFLMGQVAGGLARYAQIEPMLERIEHEKQLERARLARKRAAKNKA